MINEWQVMEAMRAALQRLLDTAPVDKTNPNPWQDAHNALALYHRWRSESAPGIFSDLAHVIGRAAGDVAQTVGGTAENVGAAIKGAGS